MTLYLDASVIVPLIVPEASSEAIGHLLRRQTERPVVSDLAVAEISAAISRLVRMRRFAPEQGRGQLRRFDRWMAQEATGLSVQSSDLPAAGRLVRIFELKLLTPDALHLVPARRSGAAIVTLDKRLALAAERVGVPPVVPA